MSEWKENSIKSFANSFAGGTPSRSRSDYFNGTIPWISSGEVNQPYIIDTVEKITLLGLENSSAKWIPKNSVLVAMYGATAGQVSKNLIDATSNQAVLALVPKKDLIDGDFLYYQVKNNKDSILYLAQGSGQPNLSKDLVDNFRINIPENLTEQTKIARILSTADAVIEKTQAAIAKCKAIKQGMLHDLFTRGIDPATGKLRPTYEDAPELYKESKLSWIPKEWEVERIENVIQPIMSNVDKHIREDEINILLCNYMDVYNNRYLTKNISFSEGSVNASELQRFSLHEQDVIITKDSETPDDIAVPAVLIQKIQNLICGYHLCILRSKDLEKLNGEFLMLQLQIQEINKQFATRANGSTRYGLTIDAIEKVKIKIPKILDEQIEIVNRLKTIDNKLQTEQNYLHKLQQIKAGLMADLLSGRKRVKVTDNEFLTENKN